MNVLDFEALTKLTNNNKTSNNIIKYITSFLLQKYCSVSCHLPLLHLILTNDVENPNIIPNKLWIIGYRTCPFFFFLLTYLTP